jgi:hypothetical protein
MKRFNHKEINEKICNNFGLDYYKKGNFTHFTKNKIEVGFIEKISSKKYLYTFLINFFSFEDKEINDDIVNFVVAKYKQQKSEIDKNIKGLNICLEQRGTNICKSTLI